MSDIPFFFQQRTGPLIFGRLGFLRMFAFGKIIDIGCGLGTTFGVNAANLDKISNEEIKSIVKKQDPGLYDWFKTLFPDEKTANYVQADATKHIPFDDKHFDCAVLSEVLEHLDETETQAMLKEAGRVADYVIISVPNEWEWPDAVSFNKKVDVEENGHISFHTQDTIIKAVENAGLNSLCYLKVNIEKVSHHVMVATNTPMLPITWRWGVGYEAGHTRTADEIITYRKILVEEKKLNTKQGMQ